MISFVGLGKLGLPLATCFAKNGVDILAIDKNKGLIDSLKEDKTPWLEARLSENIKKAKKHIKYTTSYDQVRSTSTTIILVNTPSNKTDGSFSNVYVEQTIISICENLHPKKNKGHHFILSSTVMPRTISKTLIPLIENIMPWSLDNGDFGFSFVPDFVALGAIIDDFENPDFLMIGSSNEKYALDAEDLYRKIISEDTPISHLNLPEAELAKVSLNAFITTKISFANFLKLYTDRTPENIDPVKVAMTIGQDKRIGRKYFRPGGPYGGTCFPRDTWAFTKAAEDVGLKSDQMFANEKINDQIVENIISEIIKSRMKKVILLGGAFKSGTSVVIQGLAEKLAIELGSYNISLFLYEENEETANNFKIENVTKIKSIEALSDHFYVVCNEEYAGKIPKNSVGLEPF